MLKKTIKIFFTFLLLFLISSIDICAKDNLISISGKVRNDKNRKTIENVTISVPGTNISTVTNADGYFTLKLNEKLLKSGIKAEQLGFQSKFISYSDLKNNLNDLNIRLTPTGKVLEEIIVLGGDPRKIVEAALIKIPQNYSDKDNLLSGFYRETVKKGNRFVSISEALVDVLKKSYKNRDIYGDKVQVKRGRKLMSQKSSDTIAVKLAGGPYMPVMLDIVKNGDHLFTIDEIDYFDFSMLPGEMIDDKMHFAISFKPKVNLSYPLNSGVLYIDAENLAISRAEFDLDMSDKSKVTRAILQKKPMGLHFKPQEVSGVVTYKFNDGKSYLNYIQSTIRFKCDWKKRLFSSGFTTNAEMVIVDRDDSVEKNLKFTDTYNKRKVFSDIVENYWDEDFWKEYNIIEPTESLEKAVTKLRKNTKLH